MDFTSSSWDFIHETAICRMHSIYNDKMRWEEVYNADWRNDAHSLQHDGFREPFFEIVNLYLFLRREASGHPPLLKVANHGVKHLHPYGNEWLITSLFEMEEYFSKALNNHPFTQRTHMHVWRTALKRKESRILSLLMFSSSKIRIDSPSPRKCGQLHDLLGLMRGRGRESACFGGDSLEGRMKSCYRSAPVSKKRMNSKRWRVPSSSGSLLLCSSSG